MEKLKLFFNKHESIFSSATLVLGFIWDYFTLQRVDFLTDNIFIIMYLVLAGLSIIVIDIYEDSPVKSDFAENIKNVLSFVLQFCFGGLFSAFIIFYSQSASIYTSGAFILILLCLLIGNEFFKKHYSKLIFQTTIYFTAVFSFSIYFLPVLTKQMGALIFVLSGLVSLALIGIFIFIVYRLTPELYKKSGRALFLSIFGVYLTVNILYFTNIIPPIPLSLKESGAYHLVEKNPEGNYLVYSEKSSWYEKFSLSSTIHLQPGEPVYVFSSVFAPTDLNINITHDWQYFDESEDGWVSANKITFPIRGGRNEGYRGFSKKENIFPGRWRVDIKTERGQVVGRVRFDIEPGVPKQMETKVI